MIGPGIGLDRAQHSCNDPYIYGLYLHGKGSTDQRNTENERKIPHLRYYTESLSLVSIHHSPLQSVIS
jgi:hypothetical protein